MLSRHHLDHLSPFSASYLDIFFRKEICFEGREREEGNRTLSRICVVSKWGHFQTWTAGYQHQVNRENNCDIGSHKSRRHCRRQRRKAETSVPTAAFQQLHPAPTPCSPTFHPYSEQQTLCGSTFAELSVLQHEVLFFFRGKRQ